jgi:hypothetical protein
LYFVHVLTSGQVPTIIRNPSQKLLPAGDDALRLRLSPKVEAKKNGLWGSDGSGRRLFGDETADLAMMLPAPSTTVVVGRRCDVSFIIFICSRVINHLRSVWSS